jgi:hypothetical protein
MLMGVLECSLRVAATDEEFSGQHRGRLMFPEDPAAWKEAFLQGLPDAEDFHVCVDTVGNGVHALVAILPSDPEEGEPVSPQDRVDRGKAFGFYVTDDGLQQLADLFKAAADLVRANDRAYRRRNDA